MGIVLVWARGCGMGEASSVIWVEKECRLEKKYCRVWSSFDTRDQCLYALLSAYFPVIDSTQLNSLGSNMSFVSNVPPSFRRNRV